MRGKFADAQKEHDEMRLQEEDFLVFWKDFFSSEEEIKKFAKKCWQKKITRWAFNRIEWYTKLADNQKEDNVKILFLIAMAEMIMRVKDGRFEDENAKAQSTQDIKFFFNNLDDEYKKELTRCIFRELNMKHDYVRRDLPCEKFAEIFSNIRHRIAHGKNSYDFRFHEREDILNSFEAIIEVKKKNKLGKFEKKKGYIWCHVELSYERFRRMMVENTLKILKNDVLKIKRP